MNLRGCAIEFPVDFRKICLSGGAVLRLDHAKLRAPGRIDARESLIKAGSSFSAIQAELHHAVLVLSGVALEQQGTIELHGIRIKDDSKVFLTQARIAGGVVLHGAELTGASTLHLDTDRTVNSGTIDTQNLRASSDSEVIE